MKITSGSTPRAPGNSDEKKPSAPAAEGDAELRRLVEQLRQSEARMRLMVEVVRDYAIFMLDPQGCIISWNAGAARLKGWTAEEIIGRHFSIFYDEEARLRGHPDEELRLAIRDGRYEEEGWRLRKTGDRFWANVVITAVFDEQGRHVGFTKVTRDFTERFRAEEMLRQSEERARLLVESVRDYAIFMLEPDGTIATWNAGAENVLGYRADEILGRHFSVFYPPEAAALGGPERELQTARGGGRYEEEGWRVRRGGERFWANVVLRAIVDPRTGALRGFAKVTRDLTERRRAEDEARQASLEVARERARAEEAQRGLQQRDEFMSVAAHELRTPLAALRLKVDLVARALRQAGPDHQLDPKTHAEKLEGALRQVDRFAELVERLLDVTRIVGGRIALDLQPADVAAVARSVVDDFREPAREAGCELRFSSDGDATIACDRARIEQVVTNLVSNALKYGAGRPVDVRVEGSAAGARVLVQDRGIGVSPEDVERIFGRFERAVPVRNYGGLGLGLYITRSIVEAHGGTIRVDSTPGAGATFVVDLPRARGPGEGEGQPG